MTEYDTAAAIAAVMETAPAFENDEAKLEYFWQAWGPAMRADLPDAKEAYLRDKVLRAVLFATQQFDGHLPTMAERVAAAPKPDAYVELNDMKLMSKEEHRAYMEETLKPEAYAEWLESVREPTPEEIEAHRAALAEAAEADPQAPLTDDPDVGTVVEYDESDDAENSVPSA